MAHFLKKLLQNLIVQINQLLFPRKMLGWYWLISQQKFSFASIINSLLLQEAYLPEIKFKLFKCMEKDITLLVLLNPFTCHMQNSISTTKKSLAVRSQDRGTPEYFAVRNSWNQNIMTIFSTWDYCVSFFFLLLFIGFNQSTLTESTYVFQMYN